jgi:hypothetical protein
VRPVAGYAYTSLQAIPGTVGCALIAACALAGAAGLAARHRAEPPRAEHVLVALLALATPVGLLLYSVLGTDIWSPRSLIASAPAQTLVLAALVLAVPRRGRIVAVAVTLAVLTVGTIRAVTPRFTRPPYRTIAELIDRAARPADLVELPSAPFVLDQAIPVQFKRPHTTIAHVVTRLPARPPGTRLFLVYEDGAIAYVRSALRPPGWTRVDERHWHGLVDLTMFVYRAR